MDELASRFRVLQHRYVDYLERTPVLLRRWLSLQAGVSRVEISVGRLACSLFSFGDDGSVPNWIKMLACCALVDQLSCVPYIQFLSGDVVLFCNIPATNGEPWQLYSRTSVVSQESPDMQLLIARNSILEVRIVELEKGLAEGVKLKFPRTVTLPMFEPSLDECNSFLLEKRFAAQDAIVLLHRMQDEFIGRKRALDLMCSDMSKRHLEQRRVDAKQARVGLALASDEISRLSSEVASLRSAAMPSGVSNQTDSCPIVPRRALVLAGFWNVSPNDLLRVTPHLVSRFESFTGVGGVIRRTNLQLCFPAKDQSILIDVVVEVMAEHLPQYVRQPGGLCVFCLFKYFSRFSLLLMLFGFVSFCRGSPNNPALFHALNAQLAEGVKVDSVDYFFIRSGSADSDAKILSTLANYGLHPITSSKDAPALLHTKSATREQRRTFFRHIKHHRARYHKGVETSYWYWRPPPLDTLGNPLPPPVGAYEIDLTPSSRWKQYWDRCPGAEYCTQAIVD